MAQSTLALSYASLILDNDKALSKENLLAVLSAAGIEVEGILLDAFSTSATKPVSSILENVACGAPAACQAPASGSQDNGTVVAEQKVEEEEEDEDMGLGLFD
ncbi:ribosomal protein 60S [Perkinsela sp. CCAP 1560/4]|nr:ribosomal protein 60S [Perkinsela sp. CCAP 1560/4]|eukprot:KNH07557.1 ribosomal protein 60S [Perkinsela sp. CCAP 1560/4]